MTLTSEERRTDATLWPGELAPPLEIADWISGAAPAGSSEGKATAILFWATWSDPAEPALAHLRRLEERFELIAPGRVDVVAITTLDAENHRDDVVTIVRSMAGRGPTNHGIDRGSATADAYRRAAREEDLPVCFLVDASGRLAWIGHPKALAGALEDNLAGRTDLDAARRARARELDDRRAARQALARYAVGDWSMLDALAEAPVEAIPFTPPWIFRVERVDTLARGERPEAAVEAAVDAVADPALASDPLFLASLARALRLASSEDADEYAAVALNTLEASERAATRPSDDPMLAWVRQREALDRPAALEVLAEDAFDAGRMEAGIELLRRAISMTVDHETRSARERRLAERVGSGP